MKNIEELRMAKEEVARKLREVSKKFGENALREAVIVSGWPVLEGEDHVCGFQYFHCPTLSGVTLGDVVCGVAHYFELV